MIKIDRFITPEIIDRHKKYIIEKSNIQENLNNRLKEWDKKNIAGLISNYISEKGRKIEEENLRGEFRRLLKYFIKEIEDLKKEESYENNLFIGKPKILYKKIRELEIEYAECMKYMEWESKKKNKNKIIELLNSDFGYQNFSSLGLNEREYSKLINGLLNKNSELYKEIKKKIKRVKRGQYSKESLEIIQKEILARLNIYSKNEKMKECNEKIEKEILDINIENGGIGKFVSAVQKIIKKNQDECMTNIKELDIDINIYMGLFNESTEWNAYHYVMSMGIKVCPYCNRQYITPVHSQKNGKMRADLDHFYAKSRYPFLSMSLYNLIPCCKFCNSSLKGKKEFNYEEHMNPFEDGFDEVLKFEFLPKRYGSIIDEIEIKLTGNLNKNRNEEEKIEKGKKNAEIFKLEPLYNYHSREVKELIRKRLVYSKNLIEEIKNTLKVITKKELSNEEVLEFMLSEYRVEKNSYDRPLSKFYKDIIEQLAFEKIFSEEIDITLDKRQIDVLKKYIED